MPSATVETNGSDNGLLDKFVDPALGCTPFTAPNPTNPAGASASQALNELSARAEPEGHDRAAPGQQPAAAGRRAVQPRQDQHVPDRDRPARCSRSTPTSTRNAAQYCQDMINIATPRLKLDAPMETGTASPVPGPRQQPGQLPRGQAERLVRQPELQELRADQPGHADHRRATAWRPPRRSTPRRRRPALTRAAGSATVPRCRSPQLVGRLHAGPERARVAR